MPFAASRRTTEACNATTASCSPTSSKSTGAVDLARAWRYMAEHGRRPHRIRHRRFEELWPGLKLLPIQQKMLELTQPWVYDWDSENKNHDLPMEC